MRTRGPIVIFRGTGTSVRVFYKRSIKNGIVSSGRNIMCEAERERILANTEHTFRSREHETVVPRELAPP
jgi:hypothetical protein